MRRIRGWVIFIPLGLGLLAALAIQRADRPRWTLKNAKLIGRLGSTGELIVERSEDDRHPIHRIDPVTGAPSRPGPEFPPGSSVRVMHRFPDRIHAFEPRPGDRGDSTTTSFHAADLVRDERRTWTLPRAAFRNARLDQSGRRLIVLPATIPGVIQLVPPDGPGAIRTIPVSGPERLEIGWGNGSLGMLSPDGQCFAGIWGWGREATPRRRSDGSWVRDDFELRVHRSTGELVFRLPLPPSDGWGVDGLDERGIRLARRLGRQLIVNVRTESVYDHWRVTPAGALFPERDSPVRTELRDDNRIVLARELDQSDGFRTDFQLGESPATGMAESIHRRVTHLLLGRPGMPGTTILRAEIRDAESGALRHRRALSGVALGFSEFTNVGTAIVVTRHDHDSVRVECWDPPPFFAKPGPLGPLLIGAGLTLALRFVARRRLNPGRRRPSPSQRINPQASPDSPVAELQPRASNQRTSWGASTDAAGSAE